MPQARTAMQDPQERRARELVQFDLDLRYGPALHITRLERWERACRLGLQPPQSIKDTLTATRGREHAPQMSVFEGRVA